MSLPALHSPRIPNFSSLPLSTAQKHTHLQFLNLPLTFPKKTNKSQFSPPHSLLQNHSHHSQFSFQDQEEDPEEEEEEHVIGDCVVFEEGIFDEPFVPKQVIKPQNSKNKKKKLSTTTEVNEENLIPEEWAEVQREINITKSERRKLAQHLEFGQRVERKRLAMRPIGENGIVGDGVNLKEYLQMREERLKQLKPLILDNPVFEEVKVDKDEKKKKKDGYLELSESEDESSVSRVSSNRASPRNPRLAVYGGGLEDITELFNSEIYEANATKRSEGPRKLFTKEEKILLNKRFPNLAPATSETWQPLHTLAASGDYYLMTSLLKSIVDINVPDKDGLTAIHKAILGKKMAIFNFLLRESANPFIRDKDGATLMHYAVRTASFQTIKILLLYNVDINLQDHDGWTPLHLAVQSRRTDVVKLLLIKGADKTLRNMDGLTPLDICLHFGRGTRTYGLIKLLKELPKVKLV